jgi:beta-glucosidase
MTVIRHFSLLLAALLVLDACPMRAGERTAHVPATVRSMDRAIDSLLARMTLEEKIGQLQQYPGTWADSLPEATVPPDYPNLIRTGSVGSLLNVFGSRITRELQRVAVEESRMKIPLIYGFDVVHGFRTTFPIPLAEASSWDPATVEKAAHIGAVEASAAGLHWTFAPMVDIARDPRWGRIAEGSGEDAYLGSVLAAARVRGFQGPSFQSDGAILACPKHFAGYGAAEGGRDYNTVDMSERTLRDVYLPPFKAALDAGAATFMCSFNEIGGVPSTANRKLLHDILRVEWGFDGFIVSDWNSVGELRPHGFAATDADAARFAITAGTDMDMCSGFYRDNLAMLVRSGAVLQAVIDTAARRVLRAKYMLGLFEDPYRYCSPERERTLLLNPAHIEAARDMARKSIVLLRNEQAVLPLRKGEGTVAVIGPLADDREAPLGPWKAAGEARNVVTVLEGVRKAFGTSARVLYAKGCAVNDGDTAGIAAAVAIARKADVVILAVGESADMSGESQCRSSIELPGIQEQLVRAVQGAGKPVVLILMNGRPLAIPWEAEHVPAILECWFLGLQSGHAIADVLFGDYNPSGKMPVSVPRSVGQIPIYYNHKNTGRPGVDDAPYNSRYRDLPTTPLYPFGFGLSYTAYDYAGLKIDTDTLGMADTLKAAVTVKNTGSRAGEEVVQLYVRDEYGSVTRPVKELKAFRKVSLGAGQSMIVSFAVPVSELAFTGQDMKRRVEPGSFKLSIGQDSAHGIEGSFSVAAN